MDSTVLYKVWYNRVLGTGRYREALTEDDARLIAAEFEADGQPHIEILKITTSIEVLS